MITNNLKYSFSNTPTDNRHTIELNYRILPVSRICSQRYSSDCIVTILNIILRVSGDRYMFLFFMSLYLRRTHKLKNYFKSGRELICIFQSFTLSLPVTSFQMLLKKKLNTRFPLYQNCTYWMFRLIYDKRINEYLIKEILYHNLFS